MADLHQDALLREIDEDLRNERYAHLWQRWGVWIIAAVVAVVAVVAGYQMWRGYVANERTEAAVAFVTAAREAGNNTDAAADGRAAAAFASLAQEGPAGYALMARFREAAQQAGAGQRPEAIATLNTIATDDDVAELYRGLARVQAALYEMTDGLAPDTLLALQALAASDSPWRFHADELVAADLLRSGKTAEALERYKALAEGAMVPGGIRNRARDMAAALGA